MELSTEAVFSVVCVQDVLIDSFQSDVLQDPDFPLLE